MLLLQSDGNIEILLLKSNVPMNRNYLQKEGQVKMLANETTPVYSDLAGDEDLGELVTMFVEEMPDKIENIFSLANAKDWDELQRAAHQLKGAAGSYGFHAVTPVAAALEASCNNFQTEEEVLEKLKDFISLANRLTDATPA